MELGSEFNISVSDLRIKDNNILRYLSGEGTTLFFDSGRSALKHIAFHLGSDDEVLLPEFICESVSNCFRKSKIVYYRLKEDFSIDIDDLIDKSGSKTKIIFLMHYFGHLQSNEILNELRTLADSIHAAIVEDTTHSIFSKASTVGDYHVCSIRKWMPIPKGGVLYYKNDVLGLKKILYKKDSDNERVVGMILKDLFLRDVFDCNNLYRRIFAECEERLDSQNEILLMSDFANFVASCIDISSVVRKHKKNYEYLYNGLLKKGIKPSIELNNGECPIVYLMRVPNRDIFRHYLMDNRIYCAVHWPFDNNQEESRPFAKKNSGELISLPVDQRYGEEDMRYMIDIVSSYGGEIQC